MEFREYAAHEAAAVVTRLLANQAEAQVRCAREALEAAARTLETGAAAVGVEDDVRDLVQRLEAAAGIAVQRIQQDAAKAIEAARQEAAAAGHGRQAAEAEVQTLRGQFAELTDRATTAEADLDATIEAHRQIELELVELRGLHEAARADVSRLSAEVEAERAQRVSLTATLAAAHDTQARLEAVAAEEAEARATLQAEMDAARGTLARLEEAHAALVEHLEAARTELVNSRQALEAAARERTAARADAEAARAALATARAAVDIARAERDAARGESDAARATAETARAGADFARAETEALRLELEAVRAELQTAQTTAVVAAVDERPAGRAGEPPRPSLVPEAAEACRSLAAATSTSDLLARLVQHVSRQFSRAAIFRVKAHHLEGEHAVGFEAPTDVSKLVLPLSLDSLVTRAHAAGTLTRMAADETGSAPFGGTPAVALAVPIAFQGEPVAVLYADADTPSPAAEDERPAFAALLADHATAVLARMTQELKALHELREYAAMLLQEAEQMYAADLETGRGESERQRRLQETIECARQLYTQRAALEGAVAAGLLEEEIRAAAEQGTPFARDLAVAAGQSREACRTAS